MGACGGLRQLRRCTCGGQPQFPLTLCRLRPTLGPAPRPPPQETRNNKPAAEERELMLYGGMVFADKRVFINKMDATLANLKNCERLALSTNQIDRIAPLTGMDKLRLLSLSRNALKKIERLEDVADTLEELWVSYNQIATLDGLAACANLQVLYISNNRIADWGELDKLAGLAHLREVLFLGA
jgi:Leucine-rich repeat (LRR) protein